MLVYGEENKSKRAFEISAKMEPFFTQLNQGTFAKLDRLQTQLKDANPEREKNRIAQTLYELKRELQDFEVNHESLVEEAIRNFDDELGRIESLFGDNSSHGIQTEYKTTVAKIREQLKEFNNECGKLCAAIRPLRGTFEEPESQQQLRKVMSDSLWSFSLIIGSVVKRCDTLKQMCFTHYFSQRAV